MSNDSREYIIVWYEGKNDFVALHRIIKNMLLEKIKDFDKLFVLEPFYGKEEDDTSGDITTKGRDYLDDKKLKYYIHNIIFRDLGIDLKECRVFQIIHILDADGAWIDPKNIEFDETAKKCKYGLNKIRTNDIPKVIDRNERKMRGVEILLKDFSFSKSRSKSYLGAYYNLFINSCNIDHFMSSVYNAKDKNGLAEKFNDVYGGYHYDFMCFVRDDSNKDVFFREMIYENASKILTQCASQISTERHSTIDKIADVVYANYELYKNRNK